MHKLCVTKINLRPLLENDFHKREDVEFLKAIFEEWDHFEKWVFLFLVNVYDI